MKTPAEVIGRCLDSGNVSPQSIINDLAWEGYVVVSQVELTSSLNNISQHLNEGLKLLREVR